MISPLFLDSYNAHSKLKSFICLVLCFLIHITLVDKKRGTGEFCTSGDFLHVLVLYVPHSIAATPCASSTIRFASDPPPYRSISSLFHFSSFSMRRNASAG